jgi:predicted enzyme related to lactoylglutathione lyase
MDDKLKKHGAISWSELMTTDVSAAKSFYSELFGWQLEDMPMETENMTYTVVKANGDEVAGIMPLPEGAPAGMPPVWGLYITVDNVDAAAEKATALGAKIHMPPKDIPEVGRFCVLQDPQGAFISIITYVN